MGGRLSQNNQNPSNARWTRRESVMGSRPGEAGDSIYRHSLKENMPEIDPTLARSGRTSLDQEVKKALLMPPVFMDAGTTRDQEAKPAGAAGVGFVDARWHERQTKNVFLLGSEVRCGEAG